MAFGAIIGKKSGSFDVLSEIKSFYSYSEQPHWKVEQRDGHQREEGE